MADRDIAASAAKRGTTLLRSLTDGDACLMASRLRTILHNNETRRLRRATLMAWALMTSGFWMEEGDGEGGAR